MIPYAREVGTCTRSKDPVFERGTITLLVICCLIIMAGIVSAEPLDNAHLNSTATCTTAGGSTIELPPGHFLADAKWTALDAETRRLQDAETRLTAENKSFREQAPTWSPGWKTILGAALVSIAATLAIERL